MIHLFDFESFRKCYGLNNHIFKGRGIREDLNILLAILTVSMGGNRAQVNKPHKSRFSSKATRQQHKTSLTGVDLLFF